MKFSQLAFDAATLVLPVPSNIHITPVHAGGVPGEWILAGEETNHRQVMVYLHGGGYFFGSPRSHRSLTWRLAATGKLKVLAIDYRQPPDWEYPAPLEDAIMVYRWLLDSGYKPENIFLAGDSAGGNLTLSALMRIRQLSLPMPAGGICISPWADLTGSGQSMLANQHEDPLIPVKLLRYLSKAYAGEHDPSDELLSPALADYEGFPPLLVHVGSTELLLSDAEKIVENARKAGVEVEYKAWDGMMHVFQLMAAYMPEGKEAICEIGQFIKAHIGKVRT